jgi:hypothetical protein
MDRNDSVRTLDINLGQLRTWTQLQYCLSHLLYPLVGERAQGRVDTVIDSPILR